MEREQRYLVLKIKDLEGISESELNTLSEIQVLHATNRLLRGQYEPLNCVVVESDWPEYETVWEMIVDRLNKEK